jgi:hypothetical protein
MSAGRQARGQSLRLGDEARGIDRLATIEYQCALQVAVGEQRQGCAWYQVRLNYRGQVPSPSSPDDFSADCVADRRRPLESPGRPIQNIRKFITEC